MSRSSFVQIEQLIYKISSWYTKDAALVIYGIILGGLKGLLSWLIYQHRKRIQFFKNN